LGGPVDLIQVGLAACEALELLGDVDAVFERECMAE
jgi:hypothetical protein